MESKQQSDREIYHAIVLGQSGKELLVNPTGNGFLLPSVEIPRWQRVAENLTVRMRKEWGHEVVCLFSPDEAVAAGPPIGHSYQVMESCESVPESSARTNWVPVSSLSKQIFADPADHMAVQWFLAECAKCVGALKLGPFARLGWFKELQRWVGEVIEPLGLHLTGKFAQLNASASFSLIRFETSGPAVWFKAVGKPNLREFPITLQLAKSFQQYLPPILGTRPEWNGWLALEVRGTCLGETQDAQQWRTAASTLVKLQLESIGRGGTLVDSGARDLRAPALSKLICPFLDAMNVLMQRQTKVPPPILSRSELTSLGEQIEEALTLETDLQIPDGLGNLDLNLGNVIVVEGQCVFLDWAEAYVGDPFLSFQYLVEHLRLKSRARATAGPCMTSAYTEKWQSLVSLESVKKALVLTPMLAVFAYAAATHGWSDQTTLKDPKVAGYLRSLTRRMHHEANRLRDRSALCPD